MATARITFVAAIVTADTHRYRCAIAAKFDGTASCPNVLVVVFETRGQIVAEAATRQACKASPNTHDVANRCRGCDDSVSLSIGADRSTYRNRSLLRQTLGHIFDRTTDGIASIKRALWTAQNFDAFDFIYIENGSLWAVQINVVEINADAGFETRHGILLADAADKCGQS